MKMRNGFVSNSSSSSFVIMCKEDDYNKTLKTIHPYYKAWLENYINPEKQKFDNKNVIIISTTISTEDEEPMSWNKEYPPEAEEWDGGYADEDEEEKKEAIKWVSGSDVLYHLKKELEKVTKDIVFIDKGC